MLIGWFAAQNPMTAEEGLPLVPTTIHQVLLHWSRLGFLEHRRGGRTAGGAQKFDHRCRKGVRQRKTALVWRGGQAVDNLHFFSTPADENLPSTTRFDLSQTVRLGRKRSPECGLLTLHPSQESTP